MILVRNGLRCVLVSGPTLAKIVFRRVLGGPITREQYAFPPVGRGFHALRSGVFRIYRFMSSSACIPFSTETHLYGGS